MSSAVETTDQAAGAEQRARTERVRAEQAAGEGQRWRWLAFAVVIAAAVMDLLDSTIT